MAKEAKKSSRWVTLEQNFSNFRASKTTLMAISINFNSSRWVLGKKIKIKNFDYDRPSTTVQCSNGRYQLNGQLIISTDGFERSVDNSRNIDWSVDISTDQSIYQLFLSTFRLADTGQSSRILEILKYSRNSRNSQKSKILENSRNSRKFYKF